MDVRKRYTGKVHPLKAWVGSSIVKRRRRGEFYGLGRSWRCLWMWVLLTLRYCSILFSCNSKIIIAKNLEKFWMIATIIRIKSTKFQIFWTITLVGIKNWSFNSKTPCYLGNLHRCGAQVKIEIELKLGLILFFLFISKHMSLCQRKNSKTPKISTTPMFIVFFLTSNSNWY